VIGYATGTSRLASFVVLRYVAYHRARPDLPFSEREARSLSLRVGEWQRPVNQAFCER